ncbi:transcription antitermination factor NusB [Spelaeicoccus albus]|uniref:Transcription antitermination protein NusB n=1 Tax=Spelaeicoccus albus TaxID=1280376 RepID=A0A7Z0D493_9MICO|nr:transcription antitermination factor NusB [Spelaeicoccus albus]NYI68612.1 N utilization substance protein B [Spelaeicoccus albus]
MGARSKSRKRALDVLYEAEQRGIAPLSMLETRSSDADYPMREYSAELVRGVASHTDEIDELLETYSQGWPLTRMPAVDRAALRIGAWEILFNDDVDGPVAVDEAVDLVRKLSTDDSPGFVSGLLGRILDMKPSLGY